MLLLALLLVVPARATATVLSQAAATTAPGTFKEITSSFGSDFLGGQILGVEACPSESILQYIGKALWNPVTNRWQLAGASHSCTGSTWSATYYDDATNTWARFANPFPGHVDPQHAHDMNAMQTTGARAGTHCISDTFNPRFITSPNNAAWATGSTPGTNANSEPTREWFPDYLGGRLIQVDGWHGIYAYNPDTGVWTCLAGGLVSTCAGNGYPATSQSISGLDNIGSASVYSARCRCIIIGGRLGGFWKLDSSGVLTALNTSGGPSNFGTGGGGGDNSNSFAADPVTGLVLVVDGSGTFRQFDPTAGATGSWSLISATVPSFISPPDAASGLAAVGIPRYGVVMYVKAPSGQNAPGTRVWIYKHGASTPLVTPEVPGNVGVR